MTDSIHNYYTLRECIDALETVTGRVEYVNVSADVYNRHKDDAMPTAETIAKRFNGSFASIRQRVDEGREMWPCPNCSTVSLSVIQNGRCPYCEAEV